MSKSASRIAALPNLNVPFFWPVPLAADMAKQGLELVARNVKFMAEEDRLHGGVKPRLATAHTMRLHLRTLVLCDYSTPGAKGTLTLVDAPYAGHTSMIAGYHEGQSLMQTLRANGVEHVFLTDWHSATPDMKDLEVDQYLAELLACIDDLDGRRQSGRPVPKAAGWRRCSLRATPKKWPVWCWPVHPSTPTPAADRWSRWSRKVL